MGEVYMQFSLFSQQQSSEIKIVHKVALTRKKEECTNADTNVTITIRELLNALYDVDERNALSAFQLSKVLNCTTREMQKLLPQLALKGRVSRVKRLIAGDNLYVYWMNDEQQKRFETTLKRESRSMSDVKEQNRRISRKLSQAQDTIRELRQELLRLKATTPDMKDPCELASRVNFLDSLLERPALSGIKRLADIRDDYKQALVIARELEVH